MKVSYTCIELYLYQIQVYNKKFIKYETITMYRNFITMLYKLILNMNIFKIIVK